MMKITKYGHACFTVEIDGQVLVVDPGNFTHDFVMTDTIVAVVITHEHGDHFNPTILADIHDKNPESILVSLPSIIEKMPNHKSQSVAAGATTKVGPFTLEFFGGKHATIYPSIPLVDNVGVFINDKIYYSGDSFALPDKPVAVLALPVSAPWLKISETIDFLLAVKPQLVFPTHDAILSETGMSLTDNLVQRFTEANDINYNRIDGTTIEV
jgi:L-ascorbate metabolism protein UlaG (beta-lactamase superfamily)